MPSQKTDLQAAPSPSHQGLVQPEPPTDLWDKLAELENLAVELPPDALTSGEFATRYQVSPRWARERLLKMLQEGKVTRVWHRGQYYYSVNR